jgi:soluble lytic murein transglycosylase-like protein
VAVAAVAITVTLDAYTGVSVRPVAATPARAPRFSTAGSLRSEPPRRMQVNHAILRLVARPAAVDFYAAYTGSGDVARVILDAALREGVPVNLAFALGWQESRFNTHAVSNLNFYGTRDWGLFQLNDGSRPEWKREDFFDMARNAEHAMQYLRLCLAEMGSVDMALAAYNAGIRGVRKWGVPRSTRAYIRAIAAYENELDRRFGEQF